MVWDAECFSVSIRVPGGMRHIKLVAFVPQLAIFTFSVKKPPHPVLYNRYHCFEKYYFFAVDLILANMRYIPLSTISIWRATPPAVDRNLICHVSFTPVIGSRLM